MCTAILFSSINSVKVIGPSIGSRLDPSKPIIDADNDGKCQEENGNWIPCPPGVGTGSVVNAAGQLIDKVREQPAKKPKKVSLDEEIDTRRKKYKEKAAKIIEAAKRMVPQRKQDRYKEETISEINKRITSWREKYQEDFPVPVQADGETIGTFSRRLFAYKDRMNYEFENDTSEIGNDVRNWAREMFNHDIEGRTGAKYKSVPYGIKFNIADDPPRIKVDGSIKKNGKEVGDFSRVIDVDGRITHSSLNVDEKYQNDGIGSAFNAASEILYRNAGMTQINTSGLSDDDHIGATHWPKNGFDWANENNKQYFIDIIEQAIDRYESNPTRYAWMFTGSNQVANILRAIGRANREKLTDENRIIAADLIDWPGAQKWFQKADSMGVIIQYKKVL